MTKNVADLLSDLGAALKLADERFKQLTAIAQIQKALSSNQPESLEAMAELVAHCVQTGKITDFDNFFTDLEREVIRKLVQKGATSHDIAKLLGISWSAARMRVLRMGILVSEERGKTGQ